MLAPDDGLRQVLVPVVLEAGLGKLELLGAAIKGTAMMKAIIVSPRFIKRKMACMMN